ncbi:aminotransferase class V-fold PLP-dependent enzyme [Nonomuraea typhae]|uniref:Aminotransferase class V-fold PLP-dependent enzyme n=1 Tax=Nonomuraea typhae TaxID=2603600 RepID=A0ABW7Z631_9ACTN
MRSRHSTNGLLSRRALLAGTGAGALIQADTRGAAPFDPRDWDSVAAQFALNPRYANVTAWFMAPHPAAVRAAIAAYRRMLDVDPHLHHLPEEDFTRSARVRRALAEYLDVRPEEIALTDSTTMGLGLIYGGLRLRAGQEVLTTEHEFYPTHESLRLRAVRDGVVVRRIRLYDEPARASAGQMVSRLRAAIRPGTRALALTWVHSGTGVMLPLRQITRMVAEVNGRRDPGDRVLVCVDGVHGLGAEETRMPELGCDFFISGTHKWLFGPRGTGFVWGRAAAWKQVRASFTSFSMAGLTGWLNDRAPAGPPSDLHTPGGFHSYENRWALAEAVRFHQEIGHSRVSARTRSLAALLKAELAALPHVRLITPRDPLVSSGLICCTVEGLAPGAAVERLRAGHRVIAGATPYRQSSVRLGASIANTARQVETVIKAFAALRR